MSLKRKEFQMEGGDIPPRCSNSGCEEKHANGSSYFPFIIKTCVSRKTRTNLVFVFLWFISKYKITTQNLQTQFGYRLSREITNRHVSNTDIFIFYVLCRLKVTLSGKNFGKENVFSGTEARVLFGITKFKLYIRL